MTKLYTSGPWIASGANYIMKDSGGVNTLFTLTSPLSGGGLHTQRDPSNGGMVHVYGWGVDGGGAAYYDGQAGAAPGEAAAIIWNGTGVPTVTKKK